jgi:hypothetical protein
MANGQWGVGAEADGNAFRLLFVRRFPQELVRVSPQHPGNIRDLRQVLTRVVDAPEDGSQDRQVESLHVEGPEKIGLGDLIPCSGRHLLRLVECLQKLPLGRRLAGSNSPQRSRRCRLPAAAVHSVTLPQTWRTRLPTALPCDQTTTIFPVPARTK